MIILGISAYYHDSAAALIHNDIIIAAAQEERFTRKKHDSAFPTHAILYCLSECGISLDQIDSIIFYEKPLLKFERLLTSYLSEVPRGFNSFSMSMPIWIKQKLFLKGEIVKELAKLSSVKSRTLFEKVMFSEHHLSHAASAFYPSPFQDAAVLVVDGVGEWATTSLAYGSGNTIRILDEIKFPHSLGLLYSAFTYYAGFKVNSGEYKLMGLAPYGHPIYAEIIKNTLIDIKPDGSFRLNMKYFNFVSGLTMTSRHFNALFGGNPRQPESDITQKEMDLARSIQEVTEEIMIKICQTLRQKTNCENLCLAGGVALNCVANGKIRNAGIFNHIWVQPAAGDAGGALGAALSYYYQECQHPRVVLDGQDQMRGTFLGPAYSDTEIESALTELGARFEKLDEDLVIKIIVDALSTGKVIGWHHGRMEFGPRALGARSIIGDARNPDMQKKMNLKIKFRESFRPFAPSVLSEKVGQYFELTEASPYMLMVSTVKPDIREPETAGSESLFGIEKLKVVRSRIPAVTHIDYSARIQTVHQDTNPRYYRLIHEFEKLTGCAVIVNTSFNVRGEPLVCSPADSYRCFMRTALDILVIENYVLFKDDQQAPTESTDWKLEFQLD